MFDQKAIITIYNYNKLSHSPLIAFGKNPLYEKEPMKKNHQHQGNHHKMKDGQPRETKSNVTMRLELIQVRNPPKDVTAKTALTASKQSNSNMKSQPGQH